MGSVPTLWPSPNILDSLVQKSSGYFVYAATVIKFVDDKFFRPTERLALVLGLTSTDSEGPFEALDQLYTQILSGVPFQFHSKLLEILQCIIVSGQSRNPLQIDRLLELPSGETQLILRALHSVLNFEEDGISVHHASFLDFLQDPQRSLIFHIKLETCMNVARALFKALSDDGHCRDNYWYVPSLLKCPSSHHFLCSNLSVSDVDSCTSSIPPSAELVPLIRGFKPDFLWWDPASNPLEFKGQIEQVIIWFKVSLIHECLS
ncbi:hypothetical protein B0H13DRAFT_1603833 [Mycena leptocephala]|nr:hypothetical protein B0H13DRAFT_1603833 [Mycena leptocephala]